MKKYVFVLMIVTFGLFLFMSVPCFAVTETIQKKQVRSPLNLKPIKPGSLIKRQGQTIFPTVITVNPGIVTQGQKGTLMISGRHLNGNMRIRLGTGITTDTVKLINDTGTMATVQINVLANVAPGKRTVRVQYKDQVRSSNARLTINAKYKLPVIRAVSPNMFVQGKSYAVILSGVGLGSLGQVDFGPGIAVTKKSLGTRSENTIDMDIKVALSAAPGTRRVKIVDKTGVHATSVSVSVSAAASSPAMTDIPVTTPGKKIVKPAPALVKNISPPEPPLALSGMTPNRWYSGKVYKVTFFGSRFEKEMQIALGKGIDIQQVDVKNPGLAELTIKVDEKAVSGQRSLTYRLNPLSLWTESNIQGLVISSRKDIVKLPPVIKHIPLDDLKFSKGVIDLETPEFGKFMMMENWESDHGIPTSNDAVVFTWDEKQPGTSQWFELRILDREGNMLINRKIKGVPLPDSSYAPDVDFIMEIFKLFRPETAVASTGQVQVAVPSTPVSVKKSIKKTESGALTGQSSASSLTRLSENEQYIKDHLEEIDCFWQIAGFRQFTSSTYNIQTGKAIVTSNDVEVAVSEQWPLRLPEYSPTGLICSSANTQLTPAKVHDEEGAIIDDNNFYVGDTLELSGEFSLDECPWSTGYNTLWDQQTDLGTGSGSTSLDSVDTFGVYGWFFYNVFIDWGDGEWDRVFAWPTVESDTEAYESGAGQDPDDKLGKPKGNVKIAMTHTYKYAQKFPVRLFVLPEDDAGLISSIVQANKAPKGEAVYQSRYQNEEGPFDNQILLAASNITASDVPMPVMPSASKSKLSVVSASDPSIVPGFESPGSRAFLVYCQPKIVDIKADPAATGLLHLIDLSIDKFSAQQTDSVIDVSGVLNSQQKRTIPKPGGSTNTSPETSSSVDNSMSQLTSVPQAGDLMQNKSQNPPVMMSPGGADALASSCDEGFHATASLEYFGMGMVTLIWRINGIEIARSREDVGPSPVREILDTNNQYAESIKHDAKTFVSPNLPLDLAGGSLKKYELTVEAIVVGYETVQHLPQIDVNVGGAHVSTPSPDEYLKYVARSSDPKTYLVTSPIPGEPCAFQFPVGDALFFTISNLQGRVTKKNGRYSGQGTLYFKLPDGPSGMSTYYADINIINWQVADDSIVTKGEINELNLNIPIDNLPGVLGNLRQLKGKAGEPLSAVVDVFVKDSGLHRVGAVTPPEWLNTEAHLIPEDGWYAEGKTMPLTEIYWSDFQISSNDVRLDLSRLKGDKPSVPVGPLTMTNSRSSLQINTGSGNHKKRSSSGGSKSSSAPVLSQSANKPELERSSSAVVPVTSGWAGVDLGDTAKLYPYLFDLADMNVAAKGWSITDNGIEGRALFKDFSYALGDGSISFDSINITAGDHKLDAVYKNVQMNIPWPKVTLSGGDATVNYVRGQDAGKLEFHFDVDNLTVEETYQNITMTSKIKSFARLGSGWGIFTDSTFDFTDGRTHFVTTELTDLFFNVFGEAHFQGAGDQVHKRSVALNQTTTLGDAGFTINGLNVVAPANMLKPERLLFTFNGEINFYDPFVADDVNVFFALNQPSGGDVVAQGPGHSDITISTRYPGDLNPLVHIVAYPEINLPDSTGITANESSDSLLGSLFVPNAYASSGVQDSFSGEVDTSMFGDVPLPVKARFRYGTHEKNTYWLTHVLVDNIEVTIFSGVNLKGVNGGFGHGFDENVFTNNPMSAIPNNHGSTIYSAGIKIGSPATNVYEMLGQLTVNPGDGVYRMDFDDVRLFGVGLAGGHFEYGGGAFTGSVFGGFSLYNGAISCEIPENSDQVGLYFGEDTWEIWAGKIDNQINMSLFNTLKANGYYQIGLSGYRVGGGISFDTGKLCLGIAGVRAFADSSMSMGILPEGIDGSFWIDAGIQAYIPCSGRLWDDSFGQSIKVDVKAPPLKMRANLIIDVPDWLPRVPDEVSAGFDI